MPEYLAPGVYVEEVDTGPKPIEGVSTSTSGMVGVTERGPVDVPTLVIGFADFQRQFGGLLNRRRFSGNTWYLPHAVEGFFTNGGKRLYIVRVLPGTAQNAAATLYDRGESGGASTRLVATAHARDTGLLLLSNVGVAANEALKIEDGGATEYVTVNSPNGGSLALRAPLHFRHAVQRHLSVLAPVDTPTTSTLNGQANPGTQSIVVAAANVFAPNMIVRIGGAASIDREYAVITAVDVPTNTLSLSYRSNFVHANLTAVTRITPNPAAPMDLVSEANAGDRLLLLSSNAGLAQDVVVEIQGATANETEYHTADLILGVGLRTPGAFLHGTGQGARVVTFANGILRTLVGNTVEGTVNLRLNNATNLLAGRVLEIGTAATLEYGIVESFDATAGTVVLRHPLANRHNNNDPVQDRPTVNAVANSNTSLADRLLQGGTTLLLRDIPGLAGYAVNAVVELTGTTAVETEYRVIDSLPTPDVVTLAGPLERLHFPGLAVFERRTLLRVQAVDAGEWGDDLRITAEDDAPILETRMAAANQTDVQIRLLSTAGIEPGTILDINCTRNNTNGTITHGSLIKATAVQGNLVTLAAGLPANIPNGSLVRTCEFKLTVELIQINPVNNRPRVIESEAFSQLSMDSRHSRYVTNVIGPIFASNALTPRRADGRTEGESNLIRVEDLDPGQSQTTVRLGPDLIQETRPNGRTVFVPQRLTGGDDDIGNVTDATYIGTAAVNPRDRTGLEALRNIEEISIVAIPGRTSQAVQGAVLTHCELLRYRFGVLDSIRNDGIAEVQEQRGLYDSKYGALYYPWLFITDPFPDNPRLGGKVLVPPSGHMMGIYARSDIERGVHKAPANEVVRGILDFEFKFLKEHQDILNPRNINVLRDFRENNRGLRVWGARTVSSDPDWKYVNVRRLFIFIEHSIDRGTQWVVFEPNNEQLWERVKRVVSSFLTQVWRDGALMGRTREEAYFVKCDRTTMTQNDIDNGRLIVQVGIAPVKPAEFVIFRIGQWTGGSEVEEG